jgi:hypothetical protein
MKLILSGQIESISTRVDKTLKVVVGTQELSNDEAGKLVSFRNEFAKILFSTDSVEPMVEDMVNELPIKEDGKKFTDSQRLRFALFNYHKALENKEDFKTFYTSILSKLIIHYENKTNELKSK